MALVQVSALDVAKERGHTAAVAVVEQLMGSAMAGLSAGELSQILSSRMKSLNECTRQDTWRQSCQDCVAAAQLSCGVAGVGKRAGQIDALRKDATFAGDAKPRLKALRYDLAPPF